jgi:polar amino acid transport system substrate-binding protein
MKMNRRNLSALLCLWAAVPVAALAQSRLEKSSALRVGVGGSEPFVVSTPAGEQGIAVEIWQAVAAQAGWQYRFEQFDSVPKALDALTDGKIDVVVGPTSVTAERVRTARFSQPYFSSSLGILSRTESPTIWQRISPFFSESFFVAVGVLLSVLALVGTLIWLAERRVPETQFPREPGRGIAHGIWFAIVTMSTVGYGDLAPKSGLGRLVTAVWIIVSVITATSLVAGIASTLTLTGMSTSAVSTAEQLNGRAVAALADSPGEAFASRYGARVRRVGSLDEGYTLLQQRAVVALVFDRPQLQYLLRQRPDPALAMSSAEYAHQNYAFALAPGSALIPELSMQLLRLEESGRTARIVSAWLGEDDE